MPKIIRPALVWRTLVTVSRTDLAEVIRTLLGDDHGAVVEVADSLPLLLAPS